MFHISCLGWLIFRAGSIDQLVTMASSLLGAWETTEFAMRTLWCLCLFCLPVMGLQLLEEFAGDDAGVVRRFSIVPRTAVYAGLMLAILTLGSFGGREFIYFQF